jgi:hypothetical protein
MSLRLAVLQLQSNDRVTQVFGEPLKAYGQDHGGHKEGRRNCIEHREETVGTRGDLGSCSKTMASISNPISGIHSAPLLRIIVYLLV